MKQILNIAWKDIKITWRDPMGLLLMLAAPLGLTLVIAFAFGGLGGSQSSGGLQEIAVAVVNQDDGSYGQILVDVLNPSVEDITGQPDLQHIADLLAPKNVTDETEARRLVDEEQYAAAIIIPGSFSQSIALDAASFDPAISYAPPPSVITLYVNPARPLGYGVVRAVTQNIVDQMLAGSAASQISISALTASGRLDPSSASDPIDTTAQTAVQTVLSSQPITLNETLESPQNEDNGFDWLSYMAPSMAVMYLMFTMSNASRSILSEQQRGTLPRMLISPITRATVLGGKLLGVFSNGLLQMAALILGGKLLFNISYGEPLPVLLFTLVLVAAASAWGMLEAAFSRNSGQANALGWVINLSFAALAGNFIPRAAYPEWLQNLGLITPNAWGIDTYYKLIHGGTLADIGLPVLVLAGMTAVVFISAVLIFRKRFV